jgi:hypothetical protein
MGKVFYLQPSYQSTGSPRPDMHSAGHPSVYPKSAFAIGILSLKERAKMPEGRRGCCIWGLDHLVLGFKGLVECRICMKELLRRITVLPGVGCVTYHSNTINSKDLIATAEQLFKTSVEKHDSTIVSYVKFSLQTIVSLNRFSDFAL